MTRNRMAIAIAGVFACSAQAQQAPTSEIGNILIEGQVGTAAGMMLPEETPKARSSVTREAISRLPSSSNPYQAINLLPGVNSYSHDATGLFGGGLRMRGFNSDQLGFTIDGAPVNDSGSFTVFPQEYTDSENLEEIFITQGSTDTDAPHVGATGGNIGIVTSAPSDKAGVRVQQSIGSLDYSRLFVRGDTGLLFGDRMKAFISYSSSQVNKFKGPGGADRDHVDAKVVMKVGQASQISAGFLWNEAINNNYRTLSKAQIAANGTGFDFSDIAPQHLNPVAGTAQNEAAPANGYYKFNINPFRNYIATLKGNFQVTDRTRFDVEPYFWYGYGTGGNQLNVVRENNVGTQLGSGVRDINGDGDTLDGVMVYRSNITKTYRPGVTFRVTHQLDSHRLMAGYWYERARHRQTAPAIRIDSAGNTGDLWLADSSQYLLRQNGTVYNNRDQLTVSTGRSLFLQDTISMMQDKLAVVVGARRTELERNFNNYANEGTGQGADYSINQSFAKFLPSLGVKYQLTTEQSVFANVARNFKAPGNFVYQGLLTGGAFVGGQLVGATLRQPKADPETSTNLDIGYRYAGERLTFSGSVYNIDFKNRLATQFDPTQGLTVDLNVGDASVRGFEAEAGWRLAQFWRLYGSVTYTRSKMKNNLQVGANQFEQTAGKEFPDAPRWMAGAALQYDRGNWFGGIQGKHVGKRYSTLVNDEDMNKYTLFDLNAGYRFESGSLLKKPTIRFNVANLFGASYLNLNSGSGSLFTNRAQAAAGLPAPSAPSYYVGAPRFLSMVFSGEF